MKYYKIKLKNKNFTKHDRIGNYGAVGVRIYNELLFSTLSSLKQWSRLNYVFPTTRVLLNVCTLTRSYGQWVSRFQRNPKWSCRRSRVNVTKNLFRSEYQMFDKKKNVFAYFDLFCAFTQFFYLQCIRFLKFFMLSRDKCWGTGFRITRSEQKVKNLKDLLRWKSLKKNFIRRKPLWWVLHGTTEGLNIIDHLVKPRT